MARDPRKMPHNPETELHRAVCYLCGIRSSPVLTIEQTERILVAHFAADHPERLAWVKGLIEAGQLPVMRRTPQWEPIPLAKLEGPSRTM